MGQLSNLYVSQSYQGLLKLANSATGVTSTLQSVQDGLGNNIPMKVSNTQVVITGSFYGDGSNLTGITASVDTGSLLSTSSFNAYTSSNDSKVNSLISQTGSYVTEAESGSFVITGSVAGDTLTFTKGNGSQFSLQVSVATGSLPAGVVSGSQQIVDLGFATTSSVTSLSQSIAVTDLGQDNRLNSLESATSSLQLQINSKLDSSSFNSYTSSNDSKVNSLIASTGSYATTSSLTSLSQSIAVTDLGQDNRLGSLESKTGSYATTGSNNFVGQQNINGSVNITGSLNVTDSITALSASITYLKTIYQTSSVIFTSGSNILGDEASDVQTLNGTVKIPLGNLNITGNTIQIGNAKQTFSDPGNNNQVDIAVVNPFTASNGYVMSNNTLGWQHYNGAVQGWATDIWNADYSVGTAFAQSNNQLKWVMYPSGGFVSDWAYIELNDNGDRTTTIELDATRIAIDGNTSASGSMDISGSLNVRTALTASGLIYPTVDNGAESFIQTDGAGNLSLQYVKTLYQNIRNMETSSIALGTPLFVSGATGDNANVYIADAANPNRMPVTLIAGDTTLAPNGTGKGIILGHIQGVNTTGYPAGTEVYVAAGGGWTNVRPTGSTVQVQPLGIVTREGTNGMGIVLTVPPTTLPNTQTGYMWVGNGNNYPIQVATSSIAVATAVSASQAQNANLLDGKDSTEFAITGSNTFNGDQKINGNIYGFGNFANITLELNANGSGSQYPAYNAIIDTVNHPTDIYGGYGIYRPQDVIAGTTFVGLVANSYSPQYAGQTVPMIVASGSNPGGNDTVMAFTGNGQMDVWRKSNFKYGVDITGSLRVSGSAHAITGSVGILGNQNVVGTSKQTFNEPGDNQEVQVVKVNSYTDSQGYNMGINTFGWYHYNSEGHEGFASNLFTNDYAYGSAWFHDPDKFEYFMFPSGAAYDSHKFGLYDLGNTETKFEVVSENIVFTGSLITSGSSKVIGTTTITGSLNVSGSNNVTGHTSLYRDVNEGHALDVNGDTNLTRLQFNKSPFFTGTTDNLAALRFNNLTDFSISNYSNSQFPSGAYINMVSNTGSNYAQVQILPKWNNVDNQGVTISNYNGASDLYINTSNSAFVGNVSITGSFGISGSAKIIGGTTITGSLIASGSSHRLVGNTNVTGNFIANKVSAFDFDNLFYGSQMGGTVQNGTFFGYGESDYTFIVGAYSGASDNEFQIVANNTGVYFKDFNGSGYNTWLKLQPNTGNNLAPQFQRGLGITGSLIQSGSVQITGSVQGSVNALSISSNTASLNLNDGNFFTLQLVSGSATHINPSNIKPGQTVNIRLNTTGSGTVTFPSSVKQVSGSAYVPTTTTGVDVITLVSFDTSSLYLANVKNLV